MAQSLFPNFLEYSRFVRRCNALLPSIQVIRQALVFKEVEGISVSIIDSFPIPLCQPIRNFRSKVLGDYANVGYDASKGQYFYGCKCHALVSESGYVIDYTITPASMADSSMTDQGFQLKLEMILLAYSLLLKWFCCKVFQKIYFSVTLRKKTERTEV